jgi:hypothetical protein
MTDSVVSENDRLPGWHIYLMLALMAASLLPIWITAQFPSQNGPWYLLVVHMVKELGSPQWNFADFYQVNWNPVPHSLNELLMLGLYYFMPLLTAEKVALTVYALALPLSIFYFLGAVAPKWKFMGYLSFLAIHTFTVYRGYQDFSLSIPLFFFAFTFWYRHRDTARLPHWILLALLSAAIFLAHLVTFVMLAGTIGYFRLLETRQIRKALFACLAVTWVGWILVVDYVFLIEEKHSAFRPEDTSFVPFHTALESIARDMFYTISPLAYVIAVLPWLWLAYFLGRRIWRSVRQSGGLRELSSDPIFVITTSLAVTYFVTPEKLAGWHEVNTRLVPFMLLMGLACGGSVASAATRRIRLALISTVAVAAVIVYGLLAVEVVRMNRDIEEYVSGIPYFQPNSRLLSLHSENDAFGQVRPVTRAHEHYHIAKGGANGFSVARYDHLTLLWYRNPPATTFPRFRTEAFPEYRTAAFDESLRHVSEAYEHVLIWGRADDLPARLKAAGFRLVHRQGRLQLFQNENLPIASANRRSEAGLGAAAADAEPRNSRPLEGSKP